MVIIGFIFLADLGLRTLQGELPLLVSTVDGLLD